jgi:hypothetical protein
VHEKIRPIEKQCDDWEEKRVCGILIMKLQI